MKPAITTADDVKQLGTILSVWAHPDDETFTCAGIMASAVNNGQQVVCITATRGEAGVRDESRWPAAQLADIRTSELNTALKILGITAHHWLDYPDGGCIKVPEQSAASRLADYLGRYNPDTVLTFGPDGFTGHDDHKSVFRWIYQAVELSGSPAGIYCAVERQPAYDKYLKEADKQFNIYFNIDKPPVKTKEECDIYYELPPELCRLKRKALCAMPSQTKAFVEKFKPEEFEDMFCAEAFVKCDNLNGAVFEFKQKAQVGR